MTLDEAIKHAEEVAEEQERNAGWFYDKESSTYKKKCVKSEYRQLAEWLTELKQLREQTRWIPISECGYPKPEDECKNFLTIDNKGEITIQEFFLSLDKEPQPYFTGMRNIIAWMPLPKPYNVESEGKYGRISN